MEKQIWFSLHRFHVFAIMIVLSVVDQFPFNISLYFNIWLTASKALWKYFWGTFFRKKGTDSSNDLARDNWLHWNFLFFCVIRKARKDRSYISHWSFFFSESMIMETKMLSIIFFSLTSFISHLVHLCGTSRFRL